MTRLPHGTAPTSALGLLLVLLLLGACTGGDTPGQPSDSPEAPALDAPVDDAPTPVAGGSVFIAADAPPASLNAALTDGNSPISSSIFAAVLSPLWRIAPDGVYEPLLLAGEPEVGTKPFSVTYTLRDDLQWSDGMPLTAEDVAFTHRTIMNPRFDIASRRGHDLVRRVQVLDEQRVRFVFARPHGDWKAMFSEPAEAILPKHILRKADFNTVWDSELTVSSGPLEFDKWESGRITLKRNEAYWGDQPSLDEVVLSFFPDVAAQVQALQEGDVDMLYAVGQPGLLEHLQTIDGVDVQVGPRATWEHLDFNTRTPPLNKPFVRRAIAMAIDRERLVAEAAVPLYPDAAPLNSVLWLQHQPAYADHWSASVDYDPAAAERELRTNGCRKRGGTYSCGGKPLVLDFVTNSDHAVRMQVFDLLRRDLAAIGVDLRSKVAPSGDVFAMDFLASSTAWDLFVFAHQGDEHMSEVQLPWRCTSDKAINNTKYCNPRVDRLFSAAERTLDAGRRNELLAQADRLLAQDVPTLPLYQQGAYLVYRSNIAGPEHNPTEWGPLWNVGDWTLTQ